MRSVQTIISIVALYFTFTLISCQKDTQVPEATMILIEITAEPFEGGTVTGGGHYLPGTNVTVTAGPSADYYFRNWIENGIEVSSDPAYSFIAQSNRTLTAVFYDFRDPIVGVYNGTKHNYSWSMGNPPSTFDTTFAFSFSVSKHPSSIDSIIVDGGTFPLDTSLSFYEMPYPGNIRSLDFRNDSCLIYFRSGGLGGYSLTEIKGLKQ
jgi:hypothetical protein